MNGTVLAYILTHGSVAFCQAQFPLLPATFFHMEEGRQFLRKSMAMGNGDTGDPLANSYIAGYYNDYIYAALRAGSKLGSKACLSRLAFLYREGDYGQKNKALYNCVKKIDKSINWFYPPKPVENFDALCPHPTPLNITP